MKSPIEFYFDSSSPYDVASAKTGALAAGHGHEELWRPYLLGVPFKKAGIQPRVNVPMKAEYSPRDFVRNARCHGLAYRRPTRFPTGTVPAVRAHYWLEAGDEAVARGAFGSPFFIVDGEPFWGSDRMDRLERWIATGGW